MNLRLSHAKQPHSRPERIISSAVSTLIRFTRMLQVPATPGRCAIRSRVDAGNGWGVREPRMLWTTISVPRDFMPAVQLVIKPRDMPISVTTAAMPTAMPKRVRPVRMGRRHKPRVTTLRKVMSGIRGELRGVAVENNSAVFHLDGTRRSPRHGHVVSDQNESHLPLAVKIGQEIENEDCVFGIEISRRFVREKN